VYGLIPFGRIVVIAARLSAIKDVRDFVDELKPMLNGPPKR
jgi:hypothetical protein